MFFSSPEGAHDLASLGQLVAEITTALHTCLDRLAHILTHAIPALQRQTDGAVGMPSVVAPLQHAGVSRGLQFWKTLPFRKQWTLLDEMVGWRGGRLVVFDSDGEGDGEVFSFGAHTHA